MIRFLSLAAILAVPAMQAQAADLPEPTDPNFCQAVQKFISNTEVESTNTLFDYMPDYRSSKPMVDPLQTYQVVTYRGKTPVMVSCKVKGSAHLRSAYGEDAAGEQLYCPDVARALQAQSVAGLKLAGLDAAAERAAAIVIDNNEPYVAGSQYLADFELSYVDDGGKVHVQSPGLFHDYDSWTTWILPEIVEGQVYCHLATPAYYSALATGEMKPGTLITTVDDAPVTPQ